MKKILFLFTCYSFYLSVLAQSPHDKIPASFKEDETLSPLPVVKIKINEMRLKSQECVHDNKMKPFQFAIPVRLDFTPNNSGIWDTLKTGEKIWRLSLESPGAYSLNVIFGEYMLNDGAHLYIYNAEKNVVRGAFTGLSNKSPGILPVSPVPGDKLIVELNIPPGLEEYGALRLTQVAHDYKNIFKIMGNKSDQVEAGACNINIACPPGDPWQNEKRAVCRMIINGFETCSGTLVNNTSFNANPYILTANHCINSSSRASKTIFYFNYESKDCNNGEGNLNNSISGSSLLATKYSLDFSLVQLSSKIPQSFRPYFAGWNAKDSPIPTSTVTIHHPQGDVKKITIDTDAPAISSYPYDPGLDKDAFLRIFDWEAGTTEGGSSGAALFDQNHRVIGGLTGGDADCINPINDYFFRFNTAWDKYNIFESTYLETWLDPINTGLLVLDGFDPYSQVAPNCELVGNIDTEEEILLYNHEGTWGYWTGHNSDSITTYAEKFIKKETDTISGIYVNIAKAKAVNDTTKIIFKIWEGNSKPGNQAFSKAIPYGTLEDSSKNYIDLGQFDFPLDTFFVGYELSYNDSNRFALYHSQDRGGTGINTFYFLTDTGWVSIRDYSEDKLAISLDMEVIVCGKLLTNIEEQIPNHPHCAGKINIYPNPAIEQVYVQSSEPFGKTLNLKLFDVSGKVLLEHAYYAPDQLVKLDVTGIKTGLYILQVTGENKTISKPLSIINY